MISKNVIDDITWVDMESPTGDEIKQIMDEYNIHPLVAEDMVSPSIKPRLDLHERFIYLILHFPALKHTHKMQKNQEVDFIIGKNFLITVHYDTIDPIHKFSKVMEVTSILQKENIGEHAGFLFFYIIRKLYRALVHELENIDDIITDIEHRIFDGKEKKMVEEISKVSRDVLEFKQAIGMHRDVLDAFKEAGKQFFGPEFAHHTKAIFAEYLRVDHMLKSEIESVVELRETNNSLVSTKQNEVMKVLAIMAFVTFPLSLLASIFGMNTDYLPIVGHPLDFWIIVGFMFAATICFFVYFKYKGWL